MVQTKKFEQSFINEYLAWSMHDKDVEMRGRNEGRKEGRKDGETAKARSTARYLLAMGVLTREQIAAATGLSTEDIARL